MNERYNMIDLKCCGAALGHQIRKQQISPRLAKSVVNVTDLKFCPLLNGMSATDEKELVLEGNQKW